jgi:hypothetical protein
MITGLLIILTQKPLQAANDVVAEGKRFPPSVGEKTPKSKKRANVLVATAATISLVFALAGCGLLMAANSNWFFDPASGLHVQTAGLNFILQMGVCS